MSGINDWSDQCFEATPSLAARAPIEAGVSTCYDHRGTYYTPASLPGHFAYPNPGSPPTVRAIHAMRSRRRASHRYEGTVFDRPGKKVAAKYESDPYKLQKLCRQRGGKDFAVAWISEIFVDGATVDALVRPLTMLEADAMPLRLPGFKPTQGYDGFLERTNERFECGLCPDEKRMSWKNKKDAVPHLRKFHFGLGNYCTAW